MKMQEQVQEPMLKEIEFLRRCAEKAWDAVQLAEIQAMQEAMVSYARTSWRPLATAPVDEPVLVWVDPLGVRVMRKTELNEWRDPNGVMHRPPVAWMPAPLEPK